MANTNSELLDKVARGTELSVYGRGGIYPVGTVREDKEIMDEHITSAPAGESLNVRAEGSLPEELITMPAKVRERHQERPAADVEADYSVMEDGASETSEIEHRVEDEGKDNRTVLEREPVGRQPINNKGRGPDTQAFRDTVVKVEKAADQPGDSHAAVNPVFEKADVERFDALKSVQPVRETEPSGMRNLFTEQRRPENRTALNDLRPNFSENLAPDSSVKQTWSTDKKNGEAQVEKEPARESVKKPLKEARLPEDGSETEKVGARSKTSHGSGRAFPAPEPLASKVEKTVSAKGSVKIGKINILMKGAQKKEEEQWPRHPSYANHMITEDWEWSCLYGKQGS